MICRVRFASFIQDCVVSTSIQFPEQIKLLVALVIEKPKQRLKVNGSLIETLRYFCCTNGVHNHFLLLYLCIKPLRQKYT